MDNARNAALMAMAVVMVAAGPAAHAREPRGVYRLSVTPENAPPEETRAERATLRCGPDGGSHARAAAACDQLERARGDVARIPADPGACTKVLAPVEVRADGVWDGRVRRFVKTYPNRCTAVRETGGVLFAFASPGKAPGKAPAGTAQP